MYTLTLILSYSKLRMKSWQVCAYLHRQQKENGGIYMKYRLGAVLLSAAIVTSLAGCQETPDEVHDPPLTNQESPASAQLQRLANLHGVAGLRSAGGPG